MSATPAYQKPIITGKPASHASSLANRALLKRFGAGCGIVLFTAIVALIFFVERKTPFYVLAMVGSSLGILAAAKLYTASDIDYRKARSGANAEREVAKVLASLPVNEVANGLLLGTGWDADHIILGPAAAVIETKAGKGKVTYEGGVFRVGRKRLPRNPVSQAKNQARVLGNLSGVWVTAIVCVPGMSNPSFSAEGVIICGLYELPRVISTLPPVIDAFRARLFISSFTSNRDIPYSKPFAPRPTSRTHPSKQTQGRISNWLGKKPQN